MNALGQNLAIPTNPFWADFTRRIVVAALKAHGISDAERKERIMLARQCGIISDDEAEDFIVLWGLIAS